MIDQQLYVRTLSEFTRVLLTRYEVHTALGMLADRVMELFDLAGSGISLAREGRLEFDTAHGPAVAEVERAQERTQAGPCVTAYRSGQVVAVSDLDAHRDRWPEYCAVAARVGLTAAASIPMHLGEDEHSVGALNLYARGPRDWSVEDLAAATVMADMATAFLINASHHDKQVQLSLQLQRALDSRVVIEQAKGVLIERHDLTPDRAFERIRRHARSHNQSLISVAEAVVTTGLDP